MESFRSPGPAGGLMMRHGETDPGEKKQHLLWT